MDPTIFSHRVEVYTNALVIAGLYDQPIYRRVSDALNGEQRRYLPLRDATVTPLDRHGASQRVPQLLIDRSALIVVATIEEAPPPEGYDRDEYMRGTQPRQVMFFTDSFALRATLHTRPNMDLVEALERENYEEFIRLSKVQLFPIRGGAPIARDFVALRRDNIVALYGLAETRPLTPLPVMPAAEPALEAPPPPPPIVTEDSVAPDVPESTAENDPAAQ